MPAHLLQRGLNYNSKFFEQSSNSNVVYQGSFQNNIIAETSDNLAKIDEFDKAKLQEKIEKMKLEISQYTKEEEEKKSEIKSPSKKNLY